MLAPWKKRSDQPIQHIEKQDITLMTKIHLVKTIVFSVVMPGCESWTIKKAECHNKGNYKQGEKTALRLGENNSKRSNKQRINLKNIQATPLAQLQKNK